VDPDGLVEAGLIKRSGRQALKVLGDGDVAHALTVKAHRVSESAKQKLEAAGGSVEVLPDRPAGPETKRQAAHSKQKASARKREASTATREAVTK
jgi:hypothetical protein